MCVGVGVDWHPAHALVFFRVWDQDQDLDLDPLSSGLDPFSSKASIRHRHHFRSRCENERRCYDDEYNYFIIIWFFHDLRSFVFVSVFSPSDKEGVWGKR